MGAVMEGEVMAAAVRGHAGGDGVTGGGGQLVIEDACGAGAPSLCVAVSSHHSVGGVHR